ncbi:hypothetical protein [Amycolatopsis thermoflava]|uniref:hypothetical protein n=1 Tax=Amycolatopsis thermoflava TaxID=84480 RepID=UPI00380D9EEC
MNQPIGERLDNEPYPDSDYSGYAYGVNNLTNGSLRLVEIADLNPNQWTVVGVEMGRRAGSDWVSLLAVDKEATGIKQFEDFARVAAERGSIPVTRFYLPDGVSLVSLLDQTFKSFNVQLRTHAAIARPGHDLDVVDTKEL